MRTLLFALFVVVPTIPAAKQRLSTRLKQPSRTDRLRGSRLCNLAPYTASSMLGSTLLSVIHGKDRNLDMCTGSLYALSDGSPCRL